MARLQSQNGNTIQPIILVSHPVDMISPPPPLSPPLLSSPLLSSPFHRHFESYLTTRI